MVASDRKHALGLMQVWICVELGADCQYVDVGMTTGPPGHEAPAGQERQKVADCPAGSGSENVPEWHLAAGSIRRRGYRSEVQLHNWLSDFPAP